MSENDRNSSSGKGIIEKAQDALGAMVGMASAATAGSHSTEAFAKNAVCANLYEIEAAQIAMERTLSPEVRTFAEQMIKDHETMGGKMREALSRSPKAPPVDHHLDHRRQGMIDNLRSVDAAHFDEQYLQQQEAAHREAITLFEGYSQQGDDPELKSLAAASTPFLKGHLERLEAIRAQPH